MSSFVIGRSEDVAEIAVGHQHKNVSRRHAELSIIDGDNVRLVDLESANGTEVFDQNRWQRISRAVVTLDHRVRLGGEFETTVRALLSMAPQHAARAVMGPGQRVPTGSADLKLPPKQERGEAGQGGSSAPSPPVPLPGPSDRIPSTQPSVGQRTCGRCGEPNAAQGACANCGYDGVNQGAFSVIIGEIGGPARLGYFHTLRRLLRHPIDATLDLAASTTYTGHKAFLLANTTLGVSAQIYWFKSNPNLPLVPELETAVQSHGATVFTVFQYVAMLLVFLLGYRLFARFAPERRTVKDYFKLTCLSVGYTALLKALCFGLLALAAKSATPGDSQYAVLTLLLCLVAAGVAAFMVAYGIVIQKKFWNLTYAKAIPITIVLSLISTALFVSALLSFGVIATL